MKKLYIAFCLLFTLISTGCSDLLEKPTYGTQTSENFYETESQVKEALTGTYLQLRTTWNEYALNHYFIGDCTTDDALKGGGDDGDRKEVQDLANFVVYPTNGEVGRRWEILYRLINRANEVITYSQGAVGNQELINRYVNEAKVLRAFGYYILVTSFGEVPLVTKPITPGQAVRATRASLDDVYGLIIQDLTDASGLPAKGEYAPEDAYRVTSGLAKVLLAKSYMFRQDYVNAEKYLAEVVNSGKYDLFSDYGFNWRTEYENGSESVFELACKVYDKAIATGTNVPHFFTSRRVSGYQGYGFHVPTIDLLNAYDVDDPRMTYVFTRTGDRYIGDTEVQDNSESATGFHDYKMTVPRIEKQGFDVWMISYNIRLIRYADVLLLYAEALNENGKSGEALTYLNKVRQRARQTNPKDPRKDIQVHIPATTAASLPDIRTADKSSLRDIIRHERRCELAMEGWRRDDLMRQKRFGEIMRAYATKYNTEKGANFKDDRDYLLPIPQGEIDRTNGSLTQNPYY